MTSVVLKNHAALFVLTLHKNSKFLHHQRFHIMNIFSYYLILGLNTKIQAQNHFSFGIQKHGLTVERCPFHENRNIKTYMMCKCYSCDVINML